MCHAQKMNQQSDKEFWQFSDAVAGLGWQVVDTSLQGTFDTLTFAHGLSFVNRIGAAAEQAQHHPDVLLTYGSVQVTLTSHDVGTLTERDVVLAEVISQIAHEEHIVQRM